MRNFSFTILLIFTCLTLIFTQSAQDDHYCNKAHAARQFFKGKGFRTSLHTQNYDLKYYRFNWYIDPDVYGISGTVTPYFEVGDVDINQINFDLSSQLTIDSILWHGIKLTYTQPEDYRLEITFPENIKSGILDSLSILYHGAPPSGGFGSFIKSNHNGVPVLWTLSEPFGSQDWWPCKNGLDDKIDSIDIILTTPPQFRGVGNGLLVGESTTNEGLKEYHWKHRYPIAPYLIAIAVTDYSVYTDNVTLSDGHIMPMLNYVYPENLNTAKAGTAKNVKALEYFDSLFVSYPFKNEKYGHAQFGWGGGMEHQTMSYVVNFDWGLLAHELAHQWFGDFVTCGSWEDIWLNEGFATYLEGLSRERYPQSQNDWVNWKINRINTITSNPTGSVKVDNTTSVSRIFNSRLSYNKGAYLLHMLRWQLGDEAFFQGIRNYLNDRAYNYAVTHQLKAHLEAVSGQDLSNFFTKWYEGQGYPIYDIVWASNNNFLKIKVTQTTSHPSVDFFDMPLPFSIKENGIEKKLRLNNTSKEEEFIIETEGKVDEVKFDPELWLVSKHSLTNDPFILTATDDLINSLILKPNPTTDYITFDVPYTMSEFSIYSLNGKMLKSGSCEYPSTQISIQELPVGIFELQIKSGNNTKRYRVAKF